MPTTHQKKKERHPCMLHDEDALEKKDGADCSGIIVLFAGQVERDEGPLALRVSFVGF